MEPVKGRRSSKPTDSVIAAFGAAGAGRTASPTSPSPDVATSLRPIARDTLLSRLTVEIRGQIISGQLPVGSRLPPEAALASRFGVSRSLLREALSDLRTQGFIETHNGRGSFVRHPTEADLARSFAHQLELSASRPITVDDLYTARQAIETTAAEMAAQGADEDKVQTLERLIDAMRDSRDDPAAYTASDVGFHVAVAQASGNPLLHAILAPLAAMIVEGVFESHGFADAVDKGVTAHEKILDAIRCRDGARARREMQAHLAESRGFFPEGVISKHHPVAKDQPSATQ